VKVYDVQQVTDVMEKSSVTILIINTNLYLMSSIIVFKIQKDPLTTT
jgi:hypothetical protein